jgi:TonB family protein
MNVSRILRAVLLGLCLTAGVRAAFASDDDTLERAKSLYVSADYDEALAVLDRLDSTAAGEDATSIAQYRVFCLLALNRRAEARESIDRILHDRPLYMPTDNEASPRIQSIFQDVRREVLPKIVLERYTSAKQAFERKDPGAAKQFDDVLALLNDPDLGSASTLKDLREVASAFRDLARATAAVPPVVDAPKPGATGAPAPAAAEVAPDVIYTAADADVVPPASQSQRVPPWYPSSRMAAAQEYKGALRLLIDRSGAVVSATMPAGTNPEYDSALLRAAREWKFQPAQKQGKPVQYLKVIEIRLQPTKR